MVCPYPYTSSTSQNDPTERATDLATGLDNAEVKLFITDLIKSEVLSNPELESTINMSL